MKRLPPYGEAVQQNTTSQPINLDPRRIMICTQPAAALSGLFISITAQAVNRSAHARIAAESDAKSHLSQAVEQRALEILATAPVRQAVAQGLKTLEASDAASKSEALRFERSALDETANAYTERTVIT